MRSALVLAALTLCAIAAPKLKAQWQIQDAHITADLRGIDYVGNGVAWASGTNGTVLRTEDLGFVWQLCAMPPGAEKLDFRGVQAFDNNTAIVMSSGKGDLSRLYKTTDGCQTWKLVFTNPDANGFWDALKFQLQPSGRLGVPAKHVGVILGDPVEGKFSEFDTQDDGEHWSKRNDGEAGLPSAKDEEGLFAASNSSLIITNGGGEIFVTGGASGSRSRVLSEYVKHDPRVSWKYVGGDIPFAAGDSAGAFSIAIASGDDQIANTAPKDKWTLFYVARGTCVAVGGDYKKPANVKDTAASTFDSGLHWISADTSPHGYRSAVAYEKQANTWITVGPNGTDISTDDGRNWRALKPGLGDAPDADSHWNALSLPFVVGPHGRIGVLREDALKAASAKR